MVDNKQ